ncbi:hypothetical protein BKG76_11285 [Mycobacteroides franklinii]|uniref:Uncharacterized protein n=1 Tax=Mycobacteroides franklinii TaxID=948102 RepID=A0A1S1L8G2_9MYCO|nr:hypothetical protein [Mycobacteroides franklinii]OHU21252.1 hypothetical protein BKG76_11285 [Mycobacteroides franklinii]
MERTDLIFHRIGLAILTASGAFVGLWAYLAPVHWYNTFPGLGMRWLPAFGPYNEHFAKDVGAMYLALTVVGALAYIYRSNRTLVVVAAAGWTVFNLLHLIYHLTMLHMYGPRDAIVSVTLLSVLLVCSAALAVPGRENTRS